MCNLVAQTASGDVGNVFATGVHVVILEQRRQEDRDTKGGWMFVVNPLSRAV